MTSYLGLGGGSYGCMLASFAGITMTATSKSSSNAQDSKIPHHGNRPTWASPARRLGDLPIAGPMAVRNSSHRDGHSTRKLGASFTPGLPVPKQFQFCHRWRFGWYSTYGRAIPAPTLPSTALEQGATVSGSL